MGFRIRPILKLKVNLVYYMGNSKAFLSFNFNKSFPESHICYGQKKRFEQSLIFHNFKFEFNNWKNLQLINFFKK